MYFVQWLVTAFQLEKKNLAWYVANLFKHTLIKKLAVDLVQT
jgi:hypothetical protein